MEDQASNHTANNNNSSSSVSSSASISNSSSRERSNTSEPVRSRWTPKPEQILILESIFNSGMVNPPKEETVRIRKLLEKFGAVGDANVFYWFQNRRSRSRRRQRQLQASLAASAASATTAVTTTTPSLPAPSTLLGGGCVELFDYGNQQTTCTATTAVTSFAPSSASFGGAVEDVFSTFSAQMGVISPLQMDSNSSPTPVICPSDASNLEFQTGIITVFINGVATQVPEGPFDVKTIFGEEALLVHSSGVPVPFNEFGISFQSLHHGESYFLVPRLA